MCEAIEGRTGDGSSQGMREVRTPCGTESGSAVAGFRASMSSVHPLPVRVNVGCGRTPVIGWNNYDNSWSVRLAHMPILTASVRILHLLNAAQMALIETVRGSDIRWADASERIPKASGSVDAIYSSHMLEHLDCCRAAVFLSEAKRILRRGGIIRLAVPDIRFHVEDYLKHQDADHFMDAIHLGRTGPRSWRGRIMRLFAGDRSHKWMYDGKSLCRLLSESGFCEAAVVEPGTTRIPDPGALNLSERWPESVFVEAVKP